MSKSSPAVKASKLPRARVAYQDADSGTYVHPERIDRDSLSCVVLPFRTATAAREFVKVWEMTEEERVRIVLKHFAEASHIDFSKPAAMHGFIKSLIPDAKALLRALHFNTGEK